MQSRLMVSSPICLAGLFFQPLLVVHNWMSLYSQLEVEFLPFLMISSFCSALRWAGSVYLLILDWERERESREREREKNLFDLLCLDVRCKVMMKMQADSGVFTTRQRSIQCTTPWQRGPFHLVLRSFKLVCWSCPIQSHSSRLLSRFNLQLHDNSSTRFLHLSWFLFFPLLKFFRCNNRTGRQATRWTRLIIVLTMIEAIHACTLNVD